MNKKEKFYEIRGFLKAIKSLLNEEQKEYMNKEVLPFLNLLSMDAEYHKRLK